VPEIWRRVESLYAKHFDKALYRRAQQEAMLAQGQQQQQQSTNNNNVNDEMITGNLTQQHQIVVALAREERRKSRKSQKLDQKQKQNDNNNNVNGDNRKRNVDEKLPPLQQSMPTTTQLKSLYVVGLEISRPSELGKLKECVDIVNLRPKLKYKRGKKAAAAAAALAARQVRFFVVSPTHVGARDSLISAYGSEHAFYYHSQEQASDARFAVQYPSDAREIVDEFLFAFADAVIVPEKTERSRHMLFSQRALVVDERRDETMPICRPDVQCQPCWNWQSVSNATCWRDINRPTRVPRPTVCQHSLWYRW
jgi:hypothetical protein